MYYIDYQYICAVIINEMQDTQSIAEKDARIAELEAELEKRDTKIATLESQLDWLRKKVFGKMSEKCTYSGQYSATDSGDTRPPC